MPSENDNHAEPETLELPAPTGWPFVMAIGITLIAAGVVTNLALTAMGAVVFLIAAINWAWLVFAPGIGIEAVPRAAPAQRPRSIHELPSRVEHLEEGMPGHRLRLPEKIHPYSAGARGGMIGGVVMTIPALVYSLASGHGVWYPLNLLAGMVMALPELPNGRLDVAALSHFRLDWFVVGIAIHAVMSIGLGLIYGVLLPMLPSQRPIIWGGMVAPVLWTGAIHGFMGVLNPALAEVIEWPSFIAAQLAYGLVVGYVVLRSKKVDVTQ